MPRHVPQASIKMSLEKHLVKLVPKVIIASEQLSIQFHVLEANTALQASSSQHLVLLANSEQLSN